MATPLSRTLFPRLLTINAQAGPVLLRSPLPLPLRATFNPSAARSLSTSRLFRFAQPTTSPSTLQSGPVKTPNPKDAALAGIATKPEVGGVKYEDYSKGPSAIDKAAQLFFFTEILRGECCVLTGLFVFLITGDMGNEMVGGSC